MILEGLVRIEVPPLTSSVDNVDQSIAVFVPPAMPTCCRVIKVRVKLQSGHPPEAAGGWDSADPAVEESPGSDELVSVPLSPRLHHLHVISETLTGWIWLDIRCLDTWWTVSGLERIYYYRAYLVFMP